MAIIDGPRLRPRGGVAPARLVVLLHGYGADGDDLIALGAEWAKDMPDTAFVAPHAPEPCAAGSGRQWFPLTLRDPAEVVRGVELAGPALDAFLDQELARHRLPASRLALVGFSQGAMMAIDTGLRRNPACGCILGYSGVLARPGALSGAAKPAPRILLVHGAADDVLPVDYLIASIGALSAAEIAAEWHIAPALGHGIDADGLRYGASFLRESLKG
jgi:phospholipase/carboxylesterase